MATADGLFVTLKVYNFITLFADTKINHIEIYLITIGFKIIGFSRNKPL